MASVIAMVLQYLSGKLGIATGTAFRSYSGFAEDQVADHLVLARAEVAISVDGPSGIPWDRHRAEHPLRDPPSLREHLRGPGRHRPSRADEQPLPGDRVLLHGLRLGDSHRVPLRAPSCRIRTSSRLSIDSVSPDISSGTLLVVVGHSRRHRHAPRTLAPLVADLGQAPQVGNQE